MLFNFQGVKHKEDQIKKEVVQLVRTNVGALASFKEVLIVDKLPKTRSGKVARNTLAAMIAGQSYKVNPFVFHTCLLSLVCMSNFV